MVCTYSLPSSCLLSQPEKEGLNTEFGGAGIIHHVCILALFDFRSLGPYPKLSCFLCFLLPEEVFYTVYIYSNSLKKKTPNVSVRFSMCTVSAPSFAPSFFGEGF